MKFLDDKELNIVSGGHAWNPWHSSTAIKSAFDDGTVQSLQQAQPQFVVL
ncbi:hypothetical protein ACFH9D_004794 [Salmonella enterica]|nr:hypothetical protein [Salmonella enterica]EHM5771542.1 hypothetical protein [Salmonella enterica subsp. enterica serovar Urbana]EEI0826788.1 hypothetical protein [Salmonella enterica]EEK8592112.1 hypothetical protein [Salmonella enterica]EEK8755531.1 hypothetical protein [Salmonella enterica]EEO5676651.1 hypothetical protein [Salmonella enterica]